MPLLTTSVLPRLVPFCSASRLNVHCAVLHHHLVGRLAVVPIRQRLARPHVELPTVPRAGDHLALTLVAEPTLSVRSERSGHLPLADGAALVDAVVGERAELFVEAEHRNLAPTEINDDAFTGGQVVRGRDPVTGQKPNTSSAVSP